MIGRASLMLAAALACPAAAEQGVRVYNAPYEVLTGDPSCNGPGQELYRIQLSASDIVRERVRRSPKCYVSQRAGNEVEQVLVRCPEEPKTDTLSGSLQDYNLTLDAEVDICRDDWSYKIVLRSGEVQGRYGDRNVRMTLGDGAVWRLSSLEMKKIDESETVQRVQPILVLHLSCWRNDPPSPFGDLEVPFLLSEHELASCTDDKCFGEADVDQLFPQLFPRIVAGAHCDMFEVVQ